MFGTVLFGFGGERFCCVWDSLVWVWGSEFVLCVVVFVSCFGGVSLCCVSDSLVWVWGSEFVLCVGQFGTGSWE